MEKSGAEFTSDSFVSRCSMSPPSASRAVNVSAGSFGELLSIIRVAACEGSTAATSAAPGADNSVAVGRVTNITKSVAANIDIAANAAGHAGCRCQPPALGSNLFVGALIDS